MNGVPLMSRLSMSGLQPIHVTLFLFLASIGVVATAWGFELIGGYQPCMLCLMQRNPYYLAALLMLVATGLEWAKAPRWLTLILLVVVAIGYVYGGAVGFYQAGAEWGYWRGPNCTATKGAEVPANAADLLNTLNNVRIPDCEKAQWRMFGISFAGYNVFTSAALALIALAGIRVKRA
jgi:disulfide bond formation protein DsbB